MAVIRLYGPRILVADNSNPIEQYLWKTFHADADVIQTMFWVEIAGELSDAHTAALTHLLPVDMPDQSVETEWFLLPEQPYTSTWSLQVTKLAHDCGLLAVKRIEKGYAIQFNRALEDAYAVTIPNLTQYADVSAVQAALGLVNAGRHSADAQSQTILSRRQPMLHAHWAQAQDEAQSTWSKRLLSAVVETILQRYPDYAVVLPGVEAPFRQIDPETHVYRLRQEERRLSFQLAARCRSDYGCSLLGEVGQGNTIKAALLAVLTCQAPGQSELAQIYRRIHTNNTRGVPTLCGFWQPALSLKTRMISGEYGYIRPEHTTPGVSAEWVYVRIESLETFRSAQTIVERCIELGGDNPLCEIRLTQCQQPIFCVDQSRWDCFLKVIEREGCHYQVLADIHHIETMFKPVALSPAIVNAASDTENGMLPPLPVLAEKVLSAPAVADKSFLVRHVDRSAGGLVARDAMVGLWQVPISNAVATCHSFQGFSGEAMAMGECLGLSRVDLPASARMAVAEAITNLLCVDIESPENITLNVSLIASENPTADFDTAIDELAEFCARLDVQMGMTHFVEAEQLDAEGIAITALARVTDVRRIIQPRLRQHIGSSCLVLIDLGLGRHRLAGSVLSHVVDVSFADAAPDIAAETLQQFINLMLVLHQTGQAHAYHDRSDGGLFAVLSKLMFAARSGMTVSLDTLEHAYVAALFCEEAGAVIQVQEEDLDEVLNLIEAHDLPAHVLGEVNVEDRLSIRHDDEEVFAADRSVLQSYWAYYGQQLAHNQPWATFAAQEYEQVHAVDDLGLTASLTFNPEDDVAAPYCAKGTVPKVAVLRQQDGFGQMELAAAFSMAGFECHDVHVNDLKTGRLDLSQFHGLAITGAFSYGDVLGAGLGWAKTILLRPRLVECFRDFFARSDTFTLGIGNGAQLLSHLRELIPGSSAWPYFYENASKRFEARLSMVEVQPSNCIFMHGMAGTQLPIVVSHTHGRAVFTTTGGAEHLLAQQQGVLQYLNADLESTEVYPFNPDGSAAGLSSCCSLDGRVLAMLPHIERAFRTVQFSWHPHEWGEFSPWMRVFRNARVWVGEC